MNQQHFGAKNSYQALEHLFQHIWDEFPFYRQIFKCKGLSPSDDPLALLNKLPILDNTGYLKLQWDIFKRLKSKPFLIDHTSGTAGPRKIRFVTQKDEDAEEELCARFFGQCGLNSDDRVIALDVDSSEIYLFYAKALSRIGVDIFSYLNFPGSGDKLKGLLCAFKPTVLLSVPSVLWRCKSEIESLKENGYLKKLIYIGESMNNSHREVFSNRMGLDLFSFYGSTEIGSMAGECKKHEGIHIFNDAVIPTLIEPIDKGDYLIGQVVWTTLHFSDQPLVKYSTGDIISIQKKLCSCGSDYPLMAHYVSRTKEVFSIYGQKFKYEDFEKAISSKVGPVEIFKIIITSNHKTDKVVFQIPEYLKKEKNTILSAIRLIDDFDYFLKTKFVTYDVEFCQAQETIKRKSKRVLDYRL